MILHTVDGLVVGGVVWMHLMDIPGDVHACGECAFKLDGDPLGLIAEIHENGTQALPTRDPEPERTFLTITPDEPSLGTLAVSATGVMAVLPRLEGSELPQVDAGVLVGHHPAPEDIARTWGRWLFARDAWRRAFANAKAEPGETCWEIIAPGVGIAVVQAPKGEVAVPDLDGGPLDASDAARVHPSKVGWWREWDYAGDVIDRVTAIMAVAPGQWDLIAEAAIPWDAVGIAWDPSRRAIAGAVGGIPVTITTEQVLAFAAGEGLTPTEAATLIVAA
ncbi:MAG: hypothetical protein WCI83_08010, partial [Thermoleophilia bacterium]